MHDLIIYLLAMVIVVPLSKWAGLGSVIGYLIAGVIIHATGLLSSGMNEYTSQVAEFGIIMMLLLIGLELNPKNLWKMRGPIFGMGSVQVLGSVAAFSIAGHLLGLSWVSAFTVGMILSVSSTAIVMQTLQEKGYAKSVGGERALSVLLFQDMAVIPMLALFPLLGAGSGGVGNETPAVQRALLVIGAVAAVIAAGRFLIRPLFRMVSRTKLRETFTALALLIVVGTAALMHFVGLSPALGAFLAGVVLADSEFKHQIEADIEPFKGLLLGLFFMTVGASVRLDLLMAQPLTILGWMALIVTLKAGTIYAIGRVFRLRPPESLLFAVSLAQGGEFAFVLIAQAGGLISPEMGQILTAAVAVSMAVAPLLISLTIQHGMSRLDCVTKEVREPDVVDESAKENPILVVGVGRFGQTFIRFLRANGYASTILDIDSEQIEIIARFGIKSYFGDGSSLDLLRAAGLDKARALVIAVDVPETASRIVETVREHYPKLPIFSRAFDRLHAYHLLHLGVNDVAIETSGSAVELGTGVLQMFGMSEERAQSKAQLFYQNNQRSIRVLAKRFHEDDSETFLQATKLMGEQLEAMLKSDPEELAQGASSEWVPPQPAV